MNDYTIRVGKAIRSEMARRRDTQALAAELFKVSQSRVNRVLQGDFTSRSTLATRMHQHYLGHAHKIDENAHNIQAERAFQEVVGALAGLWDGTIDGAKRLKSLLEVMRWLRDGA